jgi:hypothetical protein
LNLKGKICKTQGTRPQPVSYFYEKNLYA